MEELRAALLAADYTTDAVLDRITDAGQAGLQRNVTVPAHEMLGGATDPQATLIQLWLLQHPVDIDAARAALPLDAMTEAGYVITDDELVRAAVDIRPYGSLDDGASGWVASDLQPGLDGGRPRPKSDYVLGVSPASTTLAQLTSRQRVSSALDLGTGCGVQTLHLAQHVDRVVATDVNARALELAELTLRLSGVSAELREGSLFEPTPEKFDLIVSNPPFVMSPPGGKRLVYRESNYRGDDLVRSIIAGSANHLNPGGSLQLLTNWANYGDDWASRLAEWVPDHLDAWVIERERLDVYAYIEMWLADAGLFGTPEWEPAYRRWLDYFAELGIKSVGMGWIQLTDAGRAQPDRQFETWPHLVAQPVGQVFEDRRGAIDAAEAPVEALLAARYEIAPDVTQETIGAPGGEDPEFIVLRQHVGMCRATKVDTATAAVLGACDGDLPLADLVRGVGQILGQDVTESVVPTVREALRDGMLRLIP